MLLSREEFRNSVLQRDNYKCVVCSSTTNIHVHHIIDRKLFKEDFELDGYFIDNGVSLCESHHLEAEQTILTCECLRNMAFIENVILPSHFDTDNKYDKWGNIYITAGRIKGELYYDENVQKIIKGNDFVKYRKYFRTYHFQHSNTTDTNDKVLKSDSHFHGKYVIATEKCDGENFSGYNDFCHARSLDSNNHPSRNYAKTIWFERAHLLDDNMRVCCENLYAKHTIYYENLKSYLLLLSFWIDDLCLSWSETKEYSEILNLEYPNVIYEGIYDIDLIHKAFLKYKLESKDLVEGYVVRIADSFKYSDSSKSIAKYVDTEFMERISKVQVHWNTQQIIPNKLKTN